MKDRHGDREKLRAEGLRAPREGARPARAALRMDAPRSPGKEGVIGMAHAAIRPYPDPALAVGPVLRKAGGDAVQS